MKRALSPQSGCASEARAKSGIFDETANKRLRLHPLSRNNDTSLSETGFPAFQKLLIARMEARILESLERTHCSDDALRNQAERELLNIYGSTAFPKALCDIAANDAGVSLPIRQSALLALKNYVLAGWSDSLDEFKGHVLIDDASKAVVRNALLQLATSEIADRKIQNAASYVVSKIASSDYPDEWPDLLPTLLQTIGYAGDNSIHGALKVLAELVEDGFNEDQFFKIAEDLVNILYTVSVDERKPLALKALAVSVFRGCFDILEMILEDYKAAVKTFAESAVAKWMPFFQKTLESRLPEAGTNDVTYKGAVTLKLQVMKVRNQMFRSMTLPNSSSDTYESTTTVSGHHSSSDSGSILRNLGRVDQCPAVISESLP